MNKKTKLKLNETLDKALEPPKRKNLSHLDALLSQYDSAEVITSIQPHSTPLNPTQPHPTSTTKQKISSIAPVKDYTRVPNSVVRDAVPDRLFKGTSKHTYDALYHRTRGAIVPVRIIKIRKTDLARWAGVSGNTLLKHLTHLKTTGLIKIDYELGDNNGSVYEVMIPEELDIPNPTPPHPTSPKKVGLPPPKKVELGWVGYTIENKGTYTVAKTSLNTREKTIDDESATTFTDFARLFEESSEKLTGRKLNPDDREKWLELGKLLIMELEIAAARTDSVSNLPAFLTEHLRRRLFRKQENQSGKKTSGKGSVSKSLEVGKSLTNSETIFEPFVAEPLTKKGRETLLQTMREYVNKGQIEFVSSLQDTYTSEDWQWLSENLSDEKIDH